MYLLAAIESVQMLISQKKNNLKSSCSCSLDSIISPIPFLWMSLFSKLSGKGSQTSTEKPMYPWSQRKLTGTSCLPRVAHGATQHNDRVLCLFGGVTKGTPKKDLFLIDPVHLSASAASTSGDAPSARCYHSIVSVANQLIGKSLDIFYTYRFTHWPPPLYTVFGGQLKSPADHGDNTVYSLNLRMF